MKDFSLLRHDSNCLKLAIGALREAIHLWYCSSELFWTPYANQDSANWTMAVFLHK